MITRNFHNYLIMHLTAAVTDFITRSGGTFQINGNHGNFNGNIGMSTSLAVYSSPWSRTIRIGTGTTEPTYDDYELEQFLNVTPSSVTAVTSGKYDNVYDIVTATFLNETDADWVVTEVGEYLITSSTDETAALLLAREVFDPVTVKPRQTFSVSMKLF